MHPKLKHLYSSPGLLISLLCMARGRVAWIKNLARDYSYNAHYVVD